MLSLVVRACTRPSVMVNVMSVTASKRFMGIFRAAEVVLFIIVNGQTEDNAEENCPKARVTENGLCEKQEFDDLMDKKEQMKAKAASKLAEKDRKGDDYPFEMDDEDYVPMVVVLSAVHKQVDPKTGEWNPPRGCFIGAEPTRYGDWEIKGRCFDFYSV